jgi:hypothetical protein
LQAVVRLVVVVSYFCAGTQVLVESQDTSVEIHHPKKHAIARNKTAAKAARRTR